MNNDRFRFRTPYYLGERFAGYLYWTPLFDGKHNIDRTDWQEWVKKSDHPTPRQDEQCTCLKDKNGDLIYEWDIIITDLDFGTSQDDRINIRKAVVWNNKLGCFALCSVGSEKLDDADPMHLYHNFRIIGNIHKREAAK